ncbi:MAG: MFS transporter [Alphaproteobacteria bacterium]
MPKTYMSGRTLFLLTIAAAIVAANAYYVHPIIGRVAIEFGVDQAIVGAVPAFNQIALALGIFLIMPLGDRISNRRLVLICLAAQVAALTIMALATDFWLFVAGSTLLGFFTITPYLLPAYTSKRVEPARLGHATAMLSTGVVAGLLLSRTGSGLIAEMFGWRTVYWVALGLMTTATAILPFLLEEREEQTKRDLPSYPQLIGSLLPLARQYPQTLISGSIQGLSFGIFLTVWLGIGLHLTSPEVGLGTDMVGYLAGVSALSLFTTPRLGKLADRIGARRMRLYVAMVQCFGICLLPLVGNSYWLILIPITISSTAGPMIDITGRMTCLNQAGDIRTRLMTIYVTIMFIGGGIGSWIATISYDFGGWMGTCIAAFTLSVLVVILSAWQARAQKHDEVPAIN